MALQERDLVAPIRVTPIDSLSITLDQAHDFLAYFLQADNAPVDVQARALCTRLTDGVKADLDAGLVIEPRPSTRTIKKKKKRKQVNGHNEQAPKRARGAFLLHIDVKH